MHNTQGFVPACPVQESTSLIAGSSATSTPPLCDDSCAHATLQSKSHTSAAYIVPVWVEKAPHYQGGELKMHAWHLVHNSRARDSWSAPYFSWLKAEIHCSRKLQ